jgi:hypothetical protein
MTGLVLAPGVITEKQGRSIVPFLPDSQEAVQWSSEKYREAARGRQEDLS